MRAWALCYQGGRDANNQTKTRHVVRADAELQCGKGQEEGKVSKLGRGDHARPLKGSVVDGSGGQGHRMAAAETGAQSPGGRTGMLGLSPVVLSRLALISPCPVLPQSLLPFLSFHSSLS